MSAFCHFHIVIKHFSNDPCGVRSLNEVLHRVKYLKPVDTLPFTFLILVSTATREQSEWVRGKVGIKPWRWCFLWTEGNIRVFILTLTFSVDSLNMLYWILLHYLSLKGRNSLEVIVKKLLAYRIGLLPLLIWFPFWPWYLLMLWLCLRLALSPSNTSVDLLLIFFDWNCLFYLWNCKLFFNLVSHIITSNLLLKLVT